MKIKCLLKQEKQKTELYTMAHVIIGNRTWMTHNLSVSHFRNGDPIPEVKTDEDWLEAGKNEQPAWCWPWNDSILYHDCGKIYNYFTVIDPRGLTPEGWRLPWEEEMGSLIINGELSYELVPYYAGVRASDGLFHYVDEMVSYWSLSAFDDYVRCINVDSSTASINISGKMSGRSVILLKEPTI